LSSAAQLWPEVGFWPPIIIFQKWITHEHITFSDDPIFGAFGSGIARLGDLLSLTVLDIFALRYSVSHTILSPALTHFFAEHRACFFTVWNYTENLPKSRTLIWVRSTVKTKPDEINAL
jgi:hypothetical protein